MLRLEFRKKAVDEIHCFSSLDMKTEIAKILTEEIRENLSWKDIDELLEGLHEVSSNR